MSSVELEELGDALNFYFGLPVWAPRILEGASIYSKSPRQVHSSSFIIRITLVLSDFDFDASSVVFARQVNYYYYSSKYAEVAIFVGVVGWSPQYHSSLEPGRKVLNLGTRNNGLACQNIKLWWKRSFLEPKAINKLY